MNIKIRSTGVTCLVGDDYSRIYTTLKKQLSDKDAQLAQLFTERKPGHEYLQWELPGEGWIPLSEGDPLMAQEVRQELNRRKSVISQYFGKNQDMAQKIMSVPDDSYVYYKADVDGQLLISLTAWGYRYPERVDDGGATGEYTPEGDKQKVRIHTLYDNKPLPNKELFVNGFKRDTNSSGVYEIDKLPVGYKFDLKVDDKHQVIIVQMGQSDIFVDTTVFVSVEVRATLDGNPYNGANASLSYWGHELKLTTDSNGKASVKVPKDPENGMCTISIGNDYQQLSLTQPVTIFTFNIITPQPEEVYKVDDEPEKEITTEPVNPIEEPIDGPTEEPIDEPIEEPIDGPTEEPIDEPTEEPIDEPTEEPIDEPIDEPIEEPIDGPTEVPTEVPIDEPIEEPIEDPKPEPTVEKQRSTPLIFEILAALFFLLLVIITYFFCCGMLFG